MATVKKGGNYVPGTARVGDPISFFVPLAQGSLTAGTWYRFCPSGSAGNRLTETTIDLGTLPAWLTGVDFTDWGLKILNVGYNEGGQAVPMEVKGITTAGVATVKTRINETLPANAVEWVLFPEILFDLSIILTEDSNNRMDIGIASLDVIAPTVRKIAGIAKNNYNTARQLKTTRVDRLFYRFPSVTGAQEIEWGEHEIMRA